MIFKAVWVEIWAEWPDPCALNIPERCIMSWRAAIRGKVFSVMLRTGGGLSKRLGKPAARPAGGFTPMC